MRTQENNRQACNNTSNVWRLNTLAAAMAVAMGGFSAGAFAAAPAANSLIGNTATATYTDASAVPRSATSNTVQTVVQQVGSFTLVSNNTRLVAPGGQVVYPHTLTNTGNGGDSFQLTAAQTASPTDQFDLNSFAIYADLDGNGVPDNTTNLAGSSVTLGAGGVYKFVVVGSAPGTVIANNTAVTTVTATAQTPAIYTTAAQSNTDTATVTADAVINITKSANIVTGPTGTVVEYTLTYTNTGNNTATNVNITDAIPAGASLAIGGMKYIDGSGVWSAGGALTDAAAGDPVGINYTVTGANNDHNVLITALISSVAPNVSGTIKFKVRVDDNLKGDPGVVDAADTDSKARPGILTNTANFTYDPDGAGASPVTTSQPTNSVDFLVTQTSAVAANDSTTISAIGGDDDIVTVATAGQGQTVEFENIIWNNGNGPDSFNVTYSNPATGAFPAGTSFQLFQDDKNNVLQDTNSDGIPNTPVIQPGAFYTVVLKATLPVNATGNNAGLGFSVVKTATSITDPTKMDAVTDKLDAITSNLVDLSNNTTSTPNAEGQGADNTTISTEADGTSPWETRSINPGATATFPLLVQNKLGFADNYNLTASASTLVGAVAATALPSGWTVEFRAATGASGTDCTSVGATLTNTGTINAGASRLVCAVVTTPATQTPITQNVFFDVTSPVSNASDSVYDTVTVNTYRNLAMITDRTGQVFPGGSVVYEHILTNNGNVTEGDAATEMLLTATNAPSGSGFTTVLYIDSNNNGTLDVTDAVLNGVSGTDNFHTLTAATTGYTGAGANAAGLAPTESIRIFAKVQAPAGATPGTTDTATITANVVGTVGATLPSSILDAPADPVNTDTTNVIGGQIRLDKTQALDAACDGTADAAFSTANISALPGACIMYRIEATNEGVSNVSNVIIYDTTPAFTALEVGPSAAPAVTQGTTTGINTDGATGSLGASAGTMTGGQVVVFSFSVKIDQ